MLRPGGSSAPGSVHRAGVAPRVAPRPGSTGPAGRPTGLVSQKPSVSAPARPTAGGGKDTPKLTVHTQSTKDEIGIQTLVGDYLEKGSNHGRQYYQKVQKIAGHEDIDVFLYYWDARDGADFSGWWFGDALGGSQVWAKANSHGPTPPRVGWKIPWDAPKAEAGILFVDPFKGSAAPGTAPARSGAAPTPSRPTPAAAGGAARPAAASGSLAQRVRNAQKQVDEAKIEADKLIAQSRKEANNSATEDVLQEFFDSLKKQNESLGEVQKSLTNDINEARKGGVSTMSFVTDLSKISPKLRQIQAGITAEFNKVKSMVNKLKVTQKPKTPEEEAKAREAEERDTATFQEAQAEAQEHITASEAAVEGIQAMANPLIDDAPEDGESLKAALDEIEKSATEAQNKITEARKQINMKLQAARGWAPETRKKALEEFSSLQSKLTELQKKVGPFKTFKKEFQARVEAKKALKDIDEKLNDAELEVEKASMMSSAAEHGQMSDDEITSCENLVTPSRRLIGDTLRTLEQKLRSTNENGAKEEITQMINRANESKKKLDGISTLVKGQREASSAQEMLVAAAEKVDKCEEGLAKCSEAEMPFLKGIEILPGEESASAIKDSEKAAQECGTQVQAAKSYIAKKQDEVRRFSKDVAKKIGDELNETKTRLDAAAKKLEAFRKETSERKMNALLAEAVESIAVAEKKTQAHAESAKIFSSDDLENVSVDALKEAGEKVDAAEKEANTALQEARKILAAKQRDGGKSRETAEALQKLQSRLNTAQQGMAKERKAAAAGDKLIKGKETITEQEEKITQAEGDVDKAEAMASPAEMGLGKEKLSDEDIAELDKLVKAAQGTFRSSKARVEAVLPTALPAVKAALEKLNERMKTGQEKLTAVLSKTKDQREAVRANGFVAEGKAKAELVDAAMAKVDEAELPFLKGLESLPLKEVTQTIKESDVVCAEASKTISDARTFIAAKNLEIKKFQESVAKSAAEELNAVTERVNTAANKLASFKKDMEARKKSAQMQEAEEKVASAEEAVKKLAEVVEPLKKETKKPEEGAEKKDEESTEKKEEQPEMDDETAMELLGKITDVSKEAQSQLEGARNMIAQRQRDAKEQEDKDKLKALSTRISDAQKDYQESKRRAKAHEDKYTAKKALADGEAKLKEMEEALLKTTESGASLLEHGGQEFLVAASVATLAHHLGAYMKEKELTKDAVFTQMGGSGGQLSRTDFIAYLTKLPELLGKEEVTFTEKRREEIFTSMDAVGGGQMTSESFQDIFKQRYQCLKGIAVTDVLEIATSKTTCKIEQGTIVEAIGHQQKDEATGMIRCEFRIISTDKTGWITISGNKDTTYLAPSTPFTAFTDELDKNIVDTAKSFGESLSFMQKKESELARGGKGMEEARREFAKLKSKCNSVQGGLDNLKKKVVGAKRTYALKEQAEKNAHIEAREQKEADAIVGEVTPKLAAMEANAKELQEAAAPLTSLKAEEVTSFATPASLSEEVERLLAVAVQSVSEVRSAIKEQLTKVSKAVKGPLFEAKRELQKMDSKVNTTASNNGTLRTTIKKACRACVDLTRSKVENALRKEVQAKGTTADQLFDQLAKGEERISEGSFSEFVTALADIAESVKPEHAKLLARHIDASGIGRRKFCAFVQQYFKVVKSIAVGNVFEVAKAKTLRKADIDEVMEVLEGPRVDDECGLVRVRARSLADGSEGWVSIKGNAGTFFLQEIEKPFYCCSAEIPLDHELKNEGAEPIRTLKPYELLEVIEGPQKQTFDPAIRLKGKAIKDGITGFLTIKDKKGIVYAEADGKHYSCVATVAMTDDLDIKNCKVLRKLVVGETFNLIDGPSEDKDAGITRVKGKCTKDDTEGWITVKGNAGTTYAEASSKHYSVLKEVALQKSFSSSTSETLRQLEEGEAIEAIDKPKEETFVAEVRYKVRALSDSAQGWITQKSGSVQKWSPCYKCKKATPIHDAAVIEGATVVRELAAGEVAELIEGPRLEGKDVRMKARAEKDGAVGWVTIKDGEGKEFLAC